MTNGYKPTMAAVTTQTATAISTTSTATTQTRPIGPITATTNITTMTIIAPLRVWETTTTSQTTMTPDTNMHIRTTIISATILLSFFYKQQKMYLYLEMSQSRYLEDIYIYICIYIIEIAYLLGTSNQLPDRFKVKVGTFNSTKPSFVIAMQSPICILEV